MHIFTLKGWKPLHRPTDNQITAEPPQYAGPLPSAECVRFISDLENAARDWEKRRRAAQGKAA